MMCQMIGLPPISTIGFGRTPVSSLSRVPKPPARITAFIGASLSRPRDQIGEDILYEHLDSGRQAAVALGDAANRLQVRVQLVGALGKLGPVLGDETLDVARQSTALGRDARTLRCLGRGFERRRRTLCCCNTAPSPCAERSLAQPAARLHGVPEPVREQSRLARARPSRPESACVAATLSPSARRGRRRAATATPAAAPSRPPSTRLSAGRGETGSSSARAPSHTEAVTSGPKRLL